MDLRPGPARTDGRCSLLTEERQQLICAAIADVATREEAAAKAGISAHTLGLWVQKGNRRRKGDRNGEYKAFAKAYRAAQRKGQRI